ncbi:MAG: bifunctional 2-C-methyl-D-erythritol 4-phosphate cytidylyltransferase/2-C-methyl-D-erythritol 2,4-cyclodiphosphate synthase, partial [Mesorhizobium sp.]
MSEASEKQAASAGGGIGVVIVAAGRGARAGQADGPKQYQRIGGRAVIAHT